MKQAHQRTMRLGPFLNIVAAAILVQGCSGFWDGYREGGYPLQYGGWEGCYPLGPQPQLARALPACAVSRPVLPPQAVCKPKKEEPKPTTPKPVPSKALECICRIGECGSCSCAFNAPCQGTAKPAPKPPAPAPPPSTTSQPTYYCPNCGAKITCRQAGGACIATHLPAPAPAPSPVHVPAPPNKCSCMAPNPYLYGSSKPILRYPYPSPLPVDYCGLPPYPRYYSDVGPFYKF